MYGAGRVPPAAGYHIWTTNDLALLGAWGSRRARSVSAIDRVPTRIAPVGAGTMSTAGGERPGTFAFVSRVSRDSRRTLAWLATTSSRLGSVPIPKAWVTKAEIASPVIAVMSASDTEPMPAFAPIRRRPSDVRYEGSSVK